MKHKMFSRSMIAVQAFALLMALSISAGVQAQGPQNGNNARTTFTTKSLEGRYSFINVVAALAASMGTMTFDGNGNVVDGTALGNTIILSGGKFASMTFPFTFAGTYTISANGTGRVTLFANLPDGGVQESNFDFVVLATEKVRGTVLVTELRAIQVERDQNTAQFGQVVAKRLSDQ
jgi:hypothetical protein